MRIRRTVYWTSILALVVAWFTLTSSDGTAACQAGALPPPLDEFAPDGLSYFPPGYECLYITGQNTVEPLDAAGWIDWAVNLGIFLLLLYGAVSFGVRIGLRVSGRRTPIDG